MEMQRVATCRYHLVRHLVMLFVNRGTNHLNLSVRRLHGRDALNLCSCRRRADFLFVVMKEEHGKK